MKFFPKTRCWLFGHKFVEKYSFSTDGGPIKNGRIGFYECSRCGEIKADFELKMNFDKKETSSTLAPSQVRDMNEAASLENNLIVCNPTYVLEDTTDANEDQKKKSRKQAKKV